MTTTVNQKVANPYFTESSSTFATDITVNGLTVGKGDGNVSTNTAFGVDAIGSPYITPTNINNVAVGYNALNTIGVGVNTLTLINGGSGYYDDGGETDTFQFQATLSYVSGTASAGVYPTAIFNVTFGVITLIQIVNAGYGFLNTTTVMTAVNPYGAGSGLLTGIGSIKPATNNTALGVNAGSTNKTGLKSVYIGANATGTGSNQVIIGTDISSNQDNTVVLGNSNIVNTNFYGTLNSQDSINFVGSTYSNVDLGTYSTSGVFNIATGLQDGIFNLGSDLLQPSGQFNIFNNDAPLNIGSIVGTGDITLGYSEAGQTVNIATGANTSGNKRVNICRNTDSSGQSFFDIGTPNTTIGNIFGSNLSINSQTLTATGSLQLTGSATVNQNIATSQTTGTLTIGSVDATGQTRFGQSTKTNIITLGGGATESGATKSIGIGTGGVAGAITNITFGSNTTLSTARVRGALEIRVFTVATLPTGIAGLTAFVSDSVTTLFNDAVVGGGTQTVPVFYNGFNWKVG